MPSASSTGIDCSSQVTGPEGECSNASIIHRLHQHIVLFIALQANKKASQQ